MFVLIIEMSSWFRAGVMIMAPETIVTLYKSGLSMAKVGKLVGVSVSNVKSILDSMGVQARTLKEAHKICDMEETIFDDIDSQQKAYWLGFLYADGYVSAPTKHNSGKVGISLSSKDRDHLEKLKTFLSYSGNIKEYSVSGEYKIGSKYSRILISSDRLYSSLTAKGCLPHKTNTLKPPMIRQNLIRHFLRGYIDVDGSWSKSNKDRIGFSLSICGTKEMLEWIKDYLMARTKLYQKYSHRGSDVNQYTLVVTGTTLVLRIMEHLYTDATIYLERKYGRYLEALDNVCNKRGS